MTTYLQAPAESVRNDDIEIFYSRSGEGPLMVLLHGFPDNEGSYAAQVEELARDHLVVPPRLRGFPPSSTPSEVERYALPLVADDIAALVEHLGQSPAIVVGHDWGGALAQVVALRHSSLVAGLVLLNSPLLSTFNAMVNSNAEQQAMSSYTLPYLRYQPDDDKNIPFVTRNIRDPEWRAIIGTYLNENSIEGMLAYYKANYPAPPYRPQAPAGHTFTLPTLLIWGMEEEYFAPAALDGLAKYYPASLRLVTVPGAGHWVHRDAAARVNGEIRSWLTMLPLLRGAEQEIGPTGSPSQSEQRT